MHVVQTAIQSSSRIIVTQDKDFENELLNRIGLSALSADEFIKFISEENLIDAAESIDKAGRILMRESCDLDAFINAMESEKHGMLHTARILRTAMKKSEI